MKKNPTISVCISMYNAAFFIKACIESILSQSFQNFEIIIVDDGSTDNSCEIVSSIEDERIRLIQNKHDYVGSLNLLLDVAKGKYIARMDADDVMAPNRLLLQYDFMEKHQEVDFVGGKMTAFKTSIKNPLYELNVKIGHVCISDLLEGCCICHPTVMFRASSINGLEKFRYNKKMEYAEDYDFWMRLLSAGKKCYNMDSVLAFYRLHENQVTSCYQKDQIKKSSIIREWALKKLIQLEYDAFHELVIVPKSNKELTIVIPFKNEGEEVANTIKSIRKTAALSVDIIVINDDSDDGYDYESSLQDLSVIYVRNSYRLGSAMSKERGVQLSKTPFFLLLDAHMRFFETGWVEYLVHELKTNSERLLCCKSISLQKDKNGEVSIQADTTLPQGAYLSFDSNKYIPTIHWNNYEKCLPNCSKNQIPCVLGAGYATSKKYWNKIKGLQGLVHYGCEEAYISMKAWKEGGGCYILPNLSIGHIYRNKFPYSVYSFQHICNYLIISQLLFPTSERCFATSVAWKLNKETYYKAKEYISLRTKQLTSLKKYYEKLKQHDFVFIKNLNTKCGKINNQFKNISDEEIASVFEFMSEKSNDSIEGSLFSGCAGRLIATLYYLKSGHTKYENIVYKLWERLSKAIQDENDLTFYTGLAGIGWALIYIASHNLIEDSIENELSTIDEKIMTMSVKRNFNYSFSDGLGGIYCYVVARLGFNKRNGVGNKTLSHDFLKELQEKIAPILMKCSDWRTLNFVSQYKEYLSEDWEILSPSFQEIIELPSFVPKSKKNWELNLLGVTGSVLNKLLNE